MHDLPTGPALSALARNVLLEELLPLLPRERQLEARLVAAAMAIAEREAAAGAGPSQRVAASLDKFYGAGEANACFETRPSGAPQHEAVLDGIEECPHPEPARSAESKDAPANIQQIWRRFAVDLRQGAFDDDDECGHAARAILWRLTLAKLRRANPRFLAANGFSEEPR
ncbi:MAG TPA: DUF6285 domain-containing protein [Stellaceae bacterium]|nr:DUF6285 domain-containing protein [Stellaceae bacterium]